MVTKERKKKQKLKNGMQKINRKSTAKDVLGISRTEK